MQHPPTEVRPLTYTMTQVAEVLNLNDTRGARKGLPHRRHALDLVRSGRLRVIDPSLANARWAVSRAELDRYIAGEPITKTLRAVAS